MVQLNDSLDQHGTLYTIRATLIYSTWCFPSLFSSEEKSYTYLVTLFNAKRYQLINEKAVIGEDKCIEVKGK